MSKIRKVHEMIRGAFVSAYKIKGNQITDALFSIKMTEIKLIEPYDEYCIFSTFKDVKYMVEMSEDCLVDLINAFLFKPEQYFENYFNSKSEDN